ncbi:MAG: ROK family protein [Planctomycetota bacterium]|nr:ROK family protein [Planctomycetota bacterium]
MAKRQKKAGAKSSGPKTILGIDIGGTGIKGAPVDIERGVLAKPRFRIDTPQPATPQAVAGTVAAIAKHFKWKGPIGCTFPAVIKDGVAHSAANVDKSWIGTNGRELIQQATGCPTELVNDADAAGIAEVMFGAGKGVPGTVLLLTLGTGIGSALFLDGKLVPNTELGHVIFKGLDAEKYCAESTREREKLGWKKWGKRVNRYLCHVEFLIAPDLLIIGGGVSKKSDKYFKFFNTKCHVVPAKMLNEAGIIGGAAVAKHLL